MLKILKFAVIAASIFAVVSCGSKDKKAEGPKAQEAKQLAIDAYVYGYALITSEVTRAQMTHVTSTTEQAMHAPMNNIVNVREYPPANFRAVTTPNADTLYSAAWIDVGSEPWIFSYPDMGSRYFLMPMYNMWTQVEDAPGTRTTGDKAAMYAITGPNWTGTLPQGVMQVKSSTRYAFILGRTYTTGTPEDYDATHKLQDQYKLYPLSAFGTDYVAPTPVELSNEYSFSMTDKPQKVISDMNVSEYFDILARLLADVAPPPHEDAAIIANMAKIGIVPGQKFDMSKLDPAVQEALKDVPELAFKKIDEFSKKNIGTMQNGWLIPNTIGKYGTDYLLRAGVAAFGWGANLTADAIYPYAEVDSTNATLNGANKYTMHFAKGELPPVKGFWSITMYENDQGFWFYPNPLNKYTVSERDKLIVNADGSVDLYFQHESPGADKETNWLPAPSGDFVLMLRMYWPADTAPSILPPGKGTWTIPPVVKQAP